LDVLVENESYKLIVKLPSSTEASVFILKPLETVRDLINDIREEDPKANTVVFHYLDGLRYVFILAVCLSNNE
jgi:predicted KAP-like P-loop ATPase